MKPPLTRPHYETKQNLRLEDVVSEIYARYLQVGQVKIPAKQYRMDRAAVCDGRIVGFFEIKTRTVAHNHYAFYMLSAAKFRDGVYWHNLGLSFTLVVSFTDGLFYYTYRDHDDIRYALGGRTDRNDAQDIEPLALIPMGLFRQVELTLPERIKLYAVKMNQRI